MTFKAASLPGWSGGYRIPELGEAKNIEKLCFCWLQGQELQMVREALETNQGRLTLRWALEPMTGTYLGEENYGNIHGEFGFGWWKRHSWKYILVFGGHWHWEVQKFGRPHEVPLIIHWSGICTETTSQSLKEIYVVRLNPENYTVQTACQILLWIWVLVNYFWCLLYTFGWETFATWPMMVSKCASAILQGCSIMYPWWQGIEN